MIAPNEYEIKILRTLNGEEVEGVRWGAAMSVCCEWLKENGYAEGLYHISEKGKDFLKSLDKQSGMD